MCHSKNICFVYAMQHQKLDWQNYDTIFLKCRVIRNSSCGCCAPAYNSSCPDCVLARNSSCPCCVPAPALIQPPRPHPPLTVLATASSRWKSLALQCRGECHSQSHLLGLPPTISSPATTYMSCSVLGSLAIVAFLPTNGIHVRQQTWYAQSMPGIKN